MAEGTLVVFGRAPVAGEVKTRLAQAIGADRAAALYQAFLADACALAATLPQRRVLAVAGDPDHAALQMLAGTHDLQLEPQLGADLGARLQHAIERHLPHGPVCVVGSDSPTLPARFVADAFAALASHDAVLGPSGDGGYWLVGARRAIPGLFDDIAWSTRAVLPTTLDRLRGVSTALLPFFYDVDDADDLALLRAHLPHLPPTVAPATRASLSSG